MFIATHLTGLKRKQIDKTIKIAEKTWISTQNMSDLEAPFENTFIDIDAGDF